LGTHLGQHFDFSKRKKTKIKKRIQLLRTKIKVSWVPLKEIMTLILKGEKTKTKKQKTKNKNKNKNKK